MDVSEPREVYRSAAFYLFVVLILCREDELLLSPPVALNQHPSDLLRDLEQEAGVLQRLHTRITDQLHRLMDDEANLRKQLSST